MIEYLLWAPDRATFLARMAALTNPVTGTPLAVVDANGVLVPSDCVRIDEIGPVVLTPGTYDASGNQLTAPTYVAGHHVNVAAVGQLEVLLTAGRPTTGTVFERTNILSLLGVVEYEPISATGVPEGWQGATGLRIFDPAVVAVRVRVWA